MARSSPRTSDASDNISPVMARALGDIDWEARLASARARRAEVFAERSAALKSRPRVCLEVVPAVDAPVAADVMPAERPRRTGLRLAGLALVAGSAVLAEAGIGALEQRGIVSETTSLAPAPVAMVSAPGGGAVPSDAAEAWDPVTPGSVIVRPGAAAVLEAVAGETGAGPGPVALPIRPALTGSGPVVKLPPEIGIPASRPADLTPAPRIAGAPVVAAAMPDLVPDLVPVPPAVLLPVASLRIFTPSGNVGTDAQVAAAVLAHQGFQVASVVLVDLTISSDQVRVYAEADWPAAERAAALIGAEARDFTAAEAKPPAGTLEVWLSGEQSPPTAAPAPPRIVEVAAPAALPLPAPPKPAGLIARLLGTRSNSGDGKDGLWTGTTRSAGGGSATGGGGGASAGGGGASAGGGGGGPGNGNGGGNGKSNDRGPRK